MTTAIRAGVRIRETSEVIQPALWKGCPWDDIGQPGGVRGVKFEENFENFPNYTAASNPTIAAASAILPFEYAAYYDTGDTIKQAADDPFGGCAMARAATGNNETWLQAGGNAGGCLTINDPLATDTPVGGTEPYDVWFDCRFKVSSVADDVCAMFIGIGEENMALANTKADDTGVMAGKDFIGFQTVHRNGGTAGTNAVLMFSYKNSGLTVQHVIASLATLVADTEIAVGFTHRRVNPTLRRITVWKNNVRQNTGVSDASIRLSTFPDGQIMAPLWGAKAGTATVSTFTPKYIRAAMVKGL